MVVIVVIKAAVVKVINPYIEHSFCIRQIGEHDSSIKSCGSVRLPAQRFFDHVCEIIYRGLEVQLKC
ncbi:hypothetical protein FocTR4_00016733 [Fusarium oxysporum f. sp. cubense]|uniref:Uncharacterized protein n=1 Tax=Fusarium oxysporum f. sp. cubense TaxID=61366 RepID=A0A5C6SBZ1_FUSOC|nr:hypothetical protein FocTR4_00016733 [Fusarium oxysporum f. sp. cubense]